MKYFVNGFAKPNMTSRPQTGSWQLRTVFFPSVEQIVELNPYAVGLHHVVHDHYTDPRPPPNQSGGLLNGTMWSIVNHFKCKDKAGNEAEIELKNKVPNLSADIENGKVALRTRDFGTV